MSFGGSQGTVRYAVLLQDQVTAPAQKISNEFRNMGTSMTTLTQKANVFNNAIMSNTRTFTASVTPIKNTGNALNQLSVQQKTIGSQLASIGSGFKNNALAIGAAASSVLGLYQNYANLSSAQNAANKAATAAKAAQNSVATATKNLNKAIDQYGKGSKEAVAAQNKLTVAQERAVNKAESAKIAQDNLNQTMADFGINILPNIVLAGGSFTSMLSDIGGTKGLGGLGAKFKDLGTSILGLDSPLKGLKSNLLGIGSIAAVGIVGIIGVISDLSAKLKDLQDVSSGAITPMKALGNEFDRWQNFDFTSIEGIGNTLVHSLGPTIPIMGQLKKGLEETTSATIDQTTAGGFLAARQKDVSDAQKNYNEMLGFGTDAQVAAAKAALDHAKKQLALTETFVKSAKSTDTLAVAQDKYNLSIGKGTDVVSQSISTWKLQSQAFEGNTTSINLATKAYLDVHNAIVATNPAVTENINKIKEQTAQQKAMAAAVTNSTKFVQQEDFIYSHFGDTLDNLKKKFIALNAARGKPIAFPSPAELQTQNVPGPFGGNPKAITRTFDLAAMRDNIKAIEDEEQAIVDLGKAYGLTDKDFQKFLKNGKDDTAMMNEMVAMSVNYTKALDDQVIHQQLVSKGFLDGMIKAEGYFENLVKTTEEEGVFNAALADGAQSLGIHSDLLAFSSTKMQELIKTTHEQSTAYATQAMAASKSTAFLKDQVLVMGQVHQGMLDGTIAANDWAISNVKATAQSKAFHDQLLKITQDMTGLAIPAGTTNEALQEMQTTMSETKDAGLAMAKMMTDNLTPAFERISGLIQSKDMKELRDNLKKMELPPGFKHGLDDAIKPLRNAAEEARQMGNAMDILVTAGENMSKKDLAKNMKAFGKELDRISKIKGTSAPVDAILMSLKTMSPAELGLHTKSIQFLREAIDKYGSLPTDKAEEFITMFNNETPKMGSAAATAAPKIDKLTSSLGNLNKQMAAGKPGPLANLQIGQGVSEEFKKTLPTQPTTQKTIITADNSQAIKAVDVVAKRIQSLGGIKAVISLVNNTAIKAVDVVAKRIDSLTKIKPQISLQNKQAIKAVDVVAKRIDSLTKIKPSISLNNKQAIKAVDVVANRIQGLSKINPSVNVKVGLSGPGVKFLAEGMHGVVTKPTLFMAGEAGPERVDVSPTGSPETKMAIDRKVALKPRGSVQRDSTMISRGDNFFFNIHFGDREIVKRVKAELGRTVYTMGA